MADMEDYKSVKMEKRKDKARFKRSMCSLSSFGL